MALPSNMFLIVIPNFVPNFMLLSQSAQSSHVSGGLEGATLHIKVDRSCLLDTAFEELNVVPTEDLKTRKTLQVDFYGEVCQY